jgi:transposase-like protein
VFQEHADSGLSVQRFCLDKGIAHSTFYAWRKKLSEEASLDHRDRVGLGKRSSGGKIRKPSSGVKTASPVADQNDQPAANSMINSAANASISFVPVTFPLENGPIASEPIEVVHPLGYVVRVSRRANLDCLAQIFQILDSHATK